MICIWLFALWKCCSIVLLWFHPLFARNGCVLLCSWSIFEHTCACCRSSRNLGGRGAGFHLRRHLVEFTRLHRIGFHQMRRWAQGGPGLGKWWKHLRLWTRAAWTSLDFQRGDQLPNWSLMLPEIPHDLVRTRTADLGLRHLQNTCHSLLISWYHTLLLWRSSLLGWRFHSVWKLCQDKSKQRRGVQSPQWFDCHSSELQRETLILISLDWQVAEPMMPKNLIHWDWYASRTKNQPWITSNHQRIFQRIELLM